MMLIDANAILRYLLKDNADMANKVDELLKGIKVKVRYEVVAEVVYVLGKVYKMPRNEIAEGLNIFLSLPNVETESVEVLSFALKSYADANMDFVDCVLYGFFAVCGDSVFTFDKKLNSKLKTLD
jgi:predicted nucleic-acid-binding protein